MIKIIPFEEFEEDKKVDNGEIYLENDKGERKETGSYYTPQFVVDHIIEKTIAPKIEDKLEESTQENKLEKILEINVCDPAMGSGHFLTSATDYIANRIIEEVNLGKYDIEEDDHLIWAKRKTVQNCIYGVDIVPLTVELAKLSLWFETLSKNKPLNFLDHHLKLGNSLLGSKFDEIFIHPDNDEQKSLENRRFGFGSPQKVKDDLKSQYLEIESLPEDTKDQIREKEKKYKKFLSSNKLYKQLKESSNVYTSLYYGQEVNQTLYESFITSVGGPAFESYSDSNWYSKSQTKASEKQYFHWELEFPKVFFRDRSGFDVVVGNPPYFNTHTLDQEERDYFKNNDEWPVYKGGTDIHYLFTQRGLDILNGEGKLGYITSRYWLKADHADELRRYISQNSNLDQIIDFKSAKVFKDAGIHTSIQLLSKESNLDRLEVGKVKSTRKKSEEESRRLLNKIGTHLGENHNDKDIETFNLENSELDASPWELINPERKELVSKIRDNPPLSQFAKARKGMGTGKNTVFIPDEKDIEEYNIEEDLLVNLVRNGDIDPFYVRDRKRLLYTEKVEDIDNYPNAKSYLKDNRDLLDERNEKDMEGKKWFKLSNPRNSELLENHSRKIFAPYRAEENTFAIDEQDSYSITDTTFIVSDQDIELEYLTGLLNSKLLTFYYSKIGKQKGDVFEYFAKPISKLPIKRDEEIEQEVADLSKSIQKIRENKEQLNTNILNFVKKDADGKEIGVLGQPVSDINDLLRKGKGEVEKLQIFEGRIVEEGEKKVLEVKIRFKPENKDEYKTDSNNYTYTDFIPALEFISPRKRELVLLEDFIIKAISDEFAGFKKGPTQSKDLLNRLEEIRMPDMEANDTSIRSYIQNRDKERELDIEEENKVNKLNKLIYDLYGIEEEEIKLIQSEI